MFFSFGTYGNDTDGEMHGCLFIHLLKQIGTLTDQVLALNDIIRFPQSQTLNTVIRVCDMSVI